MATSEEIEEFLVEKTLAQLAEGKKHHEISRENARLVAAEFLPQMQQSGLNEVAIVKVVGAAARNAGQRIHKETGIAQILSNSEFSQALYPDRIHPRSR